MRLFLNLVLAILLITLCACATPNVTSFSEQTVNLSTAIEQDKKAVADRMDNVIALIKASQEIERADRSGVYDARAKEWQKWRNEYTAQLSVVTQLMSEAVSYSAAVVELAEAGETGREAVNELYGTVKQFLTVAKIGGCTRFFATG